MQSVEPSHLMQLSASHGGRAAHKILRRRLSHLTRHAAAGKVYSGATQPSHPLCRSLQQIVCARNLPYSVGNMRRVYEGCEWHYGCRQLRNRIGQTQRSLE